MLDTRNRIIQGGQSGSGPVVYWMSRDQRVLDNWALIHAQHSALDHKKPLIVVFTLVPRFLGASLRQYGFMLRGLEQVSRKLAGLGIPFVLLQGQPEGELTRFVHQHNAHSLITDFDPLRIKRQWKEAVLKKTVIPVHEVDAHNIIPCWIASQKQEYGAYTLRPKIRKLLTGHLDDVPELVKHPYSAAVSSSAVNADALLKTLKIDLTVPEVGWLRPGEQQARRVLKEFIGRKLQSYDASHSDPARESQSNLSPYLHFGQISAQRVAVEVLESGAGRASVDAFIEQLLVRRELADNFCWHNGNYDSLKAAPGWAAKTLDDHRHDRRLYCYTRDDFENARTHDELWNAAQNEMVTRGKMHGYMRMYWAKKILEWSPSPEEAFETAVYLNDRYQLDGRDPNGYTGIAWSIGGVHDRPWRRRPVFGTIRYMSGNGCAAKFNVQEYIRNVNMLGAGRK